MLFHYWLSSFTASLGSLYWEVYIICHYYIARLARPSTSTQYFVYVQQLHQVGW